MPAAVVPSAPGLASFLSTLNSRPLDPSIELLISLLKRRQIRSSRPCAIATAELLRQVVANFKGKDVGKLLARIRQVGNRVMAAQPREMVVGNIVRRVLGLVREVAEEGTETNMSDAALEQQQHGFQESDDPQRPSLPSSISTFSPLKHGATQPTEMAPVAGGESGRRAQEGILRPPLLTSHTSYAASSAPSVTSLFGIFSQADAVSGTSTPRSGFGSSPAVKPSLTAHTLARFGGPVKDIKAEVIVGINEIIDELHQVDEQIAGYALDHIHSNEIILTHSSCLSVHKFLLAAARKRKFTVVHVEGYPNDSGETRATLLEGGWPKHDDGEQEEEIFRPLASAGITVIMIPDSAVFAIMSRVNKVILGTHTVLANGGLVAATGTRIIAKAAKAHQTPIVVLSGVYKLSPIYTFQDEELIEWGDAGAVVPFHEGEFVQNIEVCNALYDYVPADLVDLYITNLGGHAPSYLYRIVADHYNVEDLDLESVH